MKTKSRIWFCPLIVIGFVIILAHSCKKDVYNPPYMTDHDGNVYTSVTIGTQEWMVENLKTTKYRNGDLIGTTTPDTLDITAEATPKYQWAPNGDESNVATYGRLYTWYAITDPRNVCPSGWHIPSQDEWETLKSFLGGEDIAGGKLKETGTAHWLSPNTGATNETGFTALPSGGRSISYFGGFGTISYWWTSTSDQGLDWTADSEGMYNEYPSLVLESTSKYMGWSVRCIKDN
jgi:uncharacterized protein (TIGR02145 family)